MAMKYLITLLFSISVLFVNAQKNEFSNLEKFTIESKELGEKRSFWVGLPNNYDSTKAYATLYVLDAETRFDIAYALSKELHQNQSKTPEFIVVGVPHIDWINRKKDLTFTTSDIMGNKEKDTLHFINENEVGGGFDFLMHLENEIIPFVNDKYAANGFNVLIGHSLSGYFCAYAMSIQKSFSAFQIYDPSVWYNSMDAISHLEKTLPENFKSNAFISSGLYFKGDRKEVDFHLHCIDTLSKKMEKYPNLNLGTKIYKNKDHVSMYMYSLIDGLSFLFKDCDYGYIGMDDPVTAEEYKEYYKRASSRLGFEFTPPADGFRFVAYTKFHQKKWQEAIYAYKECYNAFENDPLVNKEIASCYKELKQPEESEKYLKKAKELESK
jgi:predicted alpha/beta superfamily hydrolase